MGVGGLVGTTGLALRTILNSSSAGTVKGYSDIGGLAGIASESTIEGVNTRAYHQYCIYMKWGGDYYPGHKR